VKPGDKITITAPGRGACTGEIEDIITPDDLPYVNEVVPPLSREYLSERGIDRLMYLTYSPFPGIWLGMFALHKACGWQDLAGQRLYIWLHPDAEQRPN
jgi:hypothetical protein